LKLGARFYPDTLYTELFTITNPQLAVEFCKRLLTTRLNLTIILAAIITRAINNFLFVVVIFL